MRWDASEGAGLTTGRERASPEVLILLSGGVDSAALVDFYVSFGRPPVALFVDYGQAAAADERIASAAVADHYGVELRTVTWRGVNPKATGLVPGRNNFLVAGAIMERPASVSVICLGIHAGTTYPDCSERFLTALQSTVGLSEDERVQLAAPFVTWSKLDIYEYCRSRRVPVHLTYSCESGAGPCGDCLSCQDRRLM